MPQDKAVGSPALSPPGFCVSGRGDSVIVRRTGAAAEAGAGQGSPDRADGAGPEHSCQALERRQAPTISEPKDGAPT